MEEFLIPHNGDYIHFAPLRGKLLLINPALKRLIETEGLDENKLDQASRDVLAEFRKNLDSEEMDFSRPGNNSITILPTFDCNLGCVYCYSKGSRSRKTIHPYIAKKGIDYLMSKIKENGSKSLSLVFHGGGEPTLAWDVLTQTFQHARAVCDAEGIELRTTISTNGAGLEDKKLEWLVQNISNIQVSMDGYERIQNMQRPLRGGQPSFHLVAKTLMYFDERDKPYSIRATVTSYGIGDLEESMQRLAGKFNPKSIHIEPVSMCGPCRKDDSLAVDGLEFARKFMELSKKLEGVRLFYSNSDVIRIRERYCGACGGNFVLTPEGNVSTCLEVSSEEDEMSDLFLVGSFDEKEDRFVISQEKLDYLQSRNVHSLPHCSDCFVRFNCAGDCLTRVFRVTGNIFDTSSNGRCELNREIGKYMLTQILEKN